MANVESISSKIFSVFNVLAAVVLSFVFLLFASKAEIIADDYSYFNHFESSGGILKYLHYHYFEHNGRVGQATFFAVLYQFFGYKSIVVAPILMFLSIGICLSLIIYKLLPFRAYSLINSLSVSIIILSSGLLLSKSMFDSYLWMTSSTVYLGGLLFNLITFTLIAYLPSNKKILLSILVIFLTATWAATFTEPLAVSSGIFCFLLGIAFFIFSYKSKSVFSFTAFLGFVAGFSIVYFSPATQARREFYGTDFSIKKIIMEIPSDLQFFFAFSQYWIVTLILLSAVSCSFILDKKNLSINILLKSLCLPVIIFLNYFIVHNMFAKMGSPVIAFRTYTNPSCFTAVALFLVFLVSAVLVSEFKIYKIIIPFAIVVSLFIFGKNFIPYSQATLSALEIRQEHLTVRAFDVSRQLDKNDSEKISLAPIPVMFHSEAVDLFPKDTPQIPWVVEAISVWYGLSGPDQAVVSDSPVNYCIETNRSDIINPQYICSAR